MEKRKKLAAAITAVMNYIRTEEEAALLARKKVELPPMMPLRLWGIDGRQMHMQIRQMMQLKAFHGAFRK